MCLLFALMLISPRMGVFVYWLGWPARWDLAFDSFIVPLIGVIMAPWTTLLYVIVAPDGVSGGDIALLACGAMLDLLSSVGGGVGGARRRQANHYQTSVYN